jgi:hypothetical protein
VDSELGPVYTDLSTTSTPALFALYRAIMTELSPGTDVFYAVRTSPSTVISVRFG